MFIVSRQIVDRLIYHKILLYPTHTDIIIVHEVPICVKVLEDCEGRRYICAYVPACPLCVIAREGEEDVCSLLLKVIRYV